MTPAPEIDFSDLSNNSVDVVRKLQASPTAKQDVQAFVVELVAALESAESLQNPAPVAQIVTAWQHTAEVYADPELLTILRQDGADFGPVPMP